MKKSTSESLKIGMTANILEWYDFSIYASMAGIIGDVFFGHNNKQLALIKALLIFSVSYLARPLGSLFFGYIADKHGRKASLSFSLIAMAIPTFLIGAFFAIVIFKLRNSINETAEFNQNINKNQRKIALAFGIVFLCIISWPLFYILNKKIFLLVIAAQILFALGLSLIDSVITATSGSLFKANVRCTCMSIGFTFSTAVFGGLSPTLCSFLIYKTGSHISPIIFLISTGIAALIATISLPKSY